MKSILRLKDCLFKCIIFFFLLLAFLVITICTSHRMLLESSLNCLRFLAFGTSILPGIPVLTYLYPEISFLEKRLSLNLPPSQMHHPSSDLLKLGICRFLRTLLVSSLHYNGLETCIQISGFQSFCPLN